jgi:hypothetical protein
VVLPVEQNPQDPTYFSSRSSYVDGIEIAATVVVNFNTPDDEVREMLNLDFAKTPDGVRLFQRELFWDGEKAMSFYTKEIAEDGLEALATDATTIKGIIVEEDAELMKLGQLVEDETEDGCRRFHIGDVLSVTTGRLISPRGMDGIYDILGYMTEDAPFTTQLGRFSDECSPYLMATIGEIIEPFSDVPEDIKDNLSMYKWLHDVTDRMNGDPFVTVFKIDGENHAVIDPITELVLDHGSEIMDKVIQVDPNLSKHDEE